jgi:hypothetical protein
MAYFNPSLQTMHQDRKERQESQILAEHCTDEEKQAEAMAAIVLSLLAMGSRQDHIRCNQTSSANQVHVVVHQGNIIWKSAVLRILPSINAR